MSGEKPFRVPRSAFRDGGPTEEGEGLAPRRAALEILTAVRKGEAFEAALSRGIARLEDADRRLAHELAAGVFRQQRDLDARLMPLARHGWSSVSHELRDILRLGAYQLVALDRIPPHAAVSTTVDLARASLGEKTAGFVNAVLRQLGGRAAPPAFALDPAAHLASRHSHPDWLVRRWLDRFGAGETERLLEWDNTRPELVVQPARVSLDELQKRFWENGVSARRAPYDAGLVLEPCRPAELPGYDSGDFIVQDPAQALVARFAAFPADAVVYDACAAPGGKSIAIGRTVRRLIAGELKQDRLPRLRENLRRAGSGREFPLAASAAAPPIRPVDGILLDAPCLGTGTLARHPDARWRVNPTALARITGTQADLLLAVAEAVRPGGWLVYATCSIEPEENQDQVATLLARLPAFRRDPAPGLPQELLTPDGDLLLLPQRHGTDGAFAARLRRVG
ncbi:MAG: 16S rRNA (cytosine(967)-C(5))-methyltransferase RsmB [Gemmatimonadales bacterium]